MFTLFRGIRKTLFKKGGMRKYLYYALGEILLVMIGILLALQVNNWNQNRLNSKVEVEVLLSIKENLMEDAENLGELEKRHIKTLLSGLRVFNGQSISEDSLNYFITNSTLASRPFIPISSAFNSSSNSGEFNLIKNRKLVQLIQRQYDFVYESTAPNHQYTDDMHRQIRNLFTEYDIIEVRTIDRGFEYFDSVQELPLNTKKLESLIKSNEFLSILKHYHFNISLLRKMYEGVLYKNELVRKENEQYLTRQG